MSEYSDVRAIYYADLLTDIPELPDAGEFIDWSLEAEWTAWPSPDAEKGVKFLFEENARLIRPSGTARPTKKHILNKALAGITISMMESDYDAMKLIFPEFTEDTDGGVENIALRAKSVEASYVKLCIEMPEGALYEILKVAPTGDFEMLAELMNLTEPEVTLETFEVSSIVGYLHKYQAAGT